VIARGTSDPGPGGRQVPTRDEASSRNEHGEPRPTTMRAAAVVVVAYRPGRATIDRLASLADVRSRTAVVVVANGAAPELADYVPPGGVTVLPFPENIGFAGGVNVGVERALAAGAVVVVIANDDVVLVPGPIAELVAAAAPDRAVAPTLTADRERDAFAGGVLDWRHGFGYHEPGGRDYLTAAALAIHRTTWERVGAFDPTLFLYYEDVDWCLRARAAGVELSVSTTTLHHAGGASSGGTDGATWAYYYTRNRIRLVARYRGRPSAVRAWAWTLAWTLGYVRDERRRLIPAQLRALRDAALGRSGRGPYPAA
jgi:GT2 family glycosyltransferase